MMLSYVLPNGRLIHPSKPRETWDPARSSGGGDAGGWLWFAWRGGAGFQGITAHLAIGEMGTGQGFEQQMPVYAGEPFYCFSVRWFGHGLTPGPGISPRV